MATIALFSKRRAFQKAVASHKVFVGTQNARSESGPHVNKPGGKKVPFSLLGVYSAHVWRQSFLLVLHKKPVVAQPAAAYVLLCFSVWIICLN